jgi:aminoglycoside 3-N-acetyltransferase I
MECKIVRLNAGQVDLFHSLNNLFGEEFDDLDTYTKNQPDSEYINKLLSNESFITLVALSGLKIVGGLVAYELQKFEQKRSEIYIYDLAVSKHHRRRGIATSLIEHLKPIAKSMGAWVIYVQADYVDPAAVALYTKLGVREDVLHFDIPV